MIVLGIDTGGAACSVALSCDSESLASDVLPMRHGHAQHLAPAIKRAFEETGLKPDVLDLIGVTVGPGAFTGLRVGLAAAGGLALATGARIVGVSSFDVVAAMCQPLKNSDRRMVVIDSRRAEPFVQLYDAHGSIGPAHWRNLPSLVADYHNQRLALAGDGAPAVAALLDRPAAILEATGPIDPVFVCRLAMTNVSNGRSDPPPPVYLRPPDAKLPGANVK